MCRCSVHPFFTLWLPLFPTVIESSRKKTLGMDFCAVAQCGWFFFVSNWQNAFESGAICNKYSHYGVKWTTAVAIFLDLTAFSAHSETQHSDFFHSLKHSNGWITTKCECSLFQQFINGFRGICGMTSQLFNAISASKITLKCIFGRRKSNLAIECENFFCVLLFIRIYMSPEAGSFYLT